jgi:hypothetical protein
LLPLAGIHAEVHATLLVAIAAQAAAPARVPRSCGVLAASVCVFVRKLPLELGFYVSELVARGAAEALAIGCDSLAEDAPGAPWLAADLAVVWWGAAARGRAVLPLLRHFPPAVRAAALARLRTGGPRASDAAVDRYLVLLSVHNN